MWRRQRSPFTKLLVLGFAASGIGIEARGAAIVNPTVYTAIDPAGGATVGNQAVNSTSLATLNGRSDLKVLQDWDGSTRADLISAAGQIISFSDTLYPDIQLKLTGVYASDAGNTADSIGTSQNTTAADGWYYRGNTGGAITLTIDFGSYDGTTFTGSANSVRAAGFTLAASGDANHTYQAVFYDGANVLSTQTATGGSGNAATIYFGYQNTAAIIDRVTLTRTNFSTQRSHFDDLAFTTVPEPATLSLLLGGGCLLGRRRVYRI